MHTRREIAKFIGLLTGGAAVASPTTGKSSKAGLRRKHRWDLSIPEGNRKWGGLWVIAEYKAPLIVSVCAKGSREPLAHVTVGQGCGGGQRLMKVQSMVGLKEGRELGLHVESKGEFTVAKVYGATEQGDSPSMEEVFYGAEYRGPSLNRPHSSIGRAAGS